MIDLPNMLDILNFAMQYLVLPLLLWNWALHRTQTALNVQIEVLKTQAEARNVATIAREAAFTRQLEQILAAVNRVDSRIDTFLGK